MSVTYTYSIVNNFNGVLYSDQLQSDILANTNITINLLRIDTAGDAVYIVFASDLGSELTYLTSTISSYVPLHVPTLSGPYIDPGTKVINYQIDSTPYIYLGNQSNEIHISTETQSQYNTIIAAIAANNIPNTIFLLHPGTYVENNPITLPTGCALRAIGHSENTFIVAQNTNQTLLNLGLMTEVVGITFEGATGGTGIYLDCTLSGGMGKFSAVMECFVKNCYVGLESDGKNGSGAIDTLYVREIVISPTTMSLSKGVYCHSSGLVTGAGLSISGVPGYFTINDAIYCSDPGSKVAISVTSIWYCSNGLTLDNGADSEFALLTCKNNNVGILIGPDGNTTRLSVNSVEIKHSTTYDISIQATNATMEIHSGAVENFILNNPNNIVINAKYHIIRYGNTYQSMTGDILFGNIDAPTKLYVGEGHFNIDGVVILSGNNSETGTWVNNTSAALTAIPNTFSMFQSTTAGNCLYVGSTKNIPGVELDIVTATSSTTNLYDVIWEYFDGTNWDQINIMQTSFSKPYTNLTSNCLSYVGYFNIRFGITTATSMASTTINGFTAYWVRCRIVNALSSIPILQFVKIHPNSTLTDNDGFIEYFGNSRTIQLLPISFLSTKSSSTTPSSQSLYLSSDIGIDYTQNMFATGVFTRIALLIGIPRNFDTSFPLKLSLLFIGDSNTSGTVQWTVRWTFINSTSNVYHLSSSAPTTATNESNMIQNSTISAADTNNKQNFLLYLNQLMSNPPTDDINLCWIAIERNAVSGNTNDTYPGNVSIVDIKAYYICWSNGGHILSF